ncbi:DUF6379 domain-containing protein [Herbiconiux sp.]|uniref:C-glycoside deglycosidase beta subunit domain-containing protein n=1 Tax=Herbiconiux sp. TaxID=1871186 RepID=UPI0025C0D397|nr:DUF6379 domain-containing protein [Herbiconiux sp.]
MTLPALRDDALVSTPAGFALRLSLPWIRSLPLSSLAGLELVVGGEPVTEQLRVVVDGRPIRPIELAEESGWWFLQDALELQVARSLAPGIHGVDVSFSLVVPYLPAGPDAPLTLPFRFERMLTLGTGSAATLPEGWVLAASGFNWTPEIIDRKRSAHDITVGIVADGVAEVVEIEAGQVWRGFPAPDGDEVDALRDGLAAVGGRIGIVGGSIDDWSSPSRRRTDEERLAFLRPQLEAAARAGAVGIRLPIGQAGPTLLDRVLPVLHELELTLFEEVQGQQTPQSPAHREACEEIVRRDDPRLRFVVDISLLMPSLPPSYLERLAAGGVPSELVRRLSDEWLDPATLDAVRGLLGSGGVPPAVHTLYMDLLIRFGRSAVGDLAGILPFTSAVHLKFWDLDDAGGRVSQPIRDIAAALDSTGFAGTLTSEWGGHEWLDDDPTAMTRAHLALARRAITEGLVRAGQ